MNRDFLIRDDYYQIMLELLELERISVGDYLINKQEIFGQKNPHFIEILYKDIQTVLEGVLNDGEGDLTIKDGDLVFEYGDFKLEGPVNNLHYAEEWLHMEMVKKLSASRHPNEFIQAIERFEKDFLDINYNTPEYQAKLKALNNRIREWRNPPKTQQNKTIKARKRIPQEAKVRAILQKEINSVCPFCINDDVGHFEIHHINEDPSNNKLQNLLLVCPTCHSKITKGDITEEQVIERKNGFYKQTNIEFVSAVIENELCNWEEKDSACFFQTESEKYSFPIFGFTFINHTNKTVVLKSIKLRLDRLPKGISGVPKRSVVTSLIKYKLCINENGNESIFPLKEPLQVPSNNAFKFQIELYEKFSYGTVPPQGRTVLHFTFEFSAGLFVAIPPVLLNCKSEDEAMQISRLN